jgi:acetyl/propionyl-CoA carboxylase alpha subunit
MNKITKLLIANRGEIAIRVMRTARTMGINTVAVYSQADRDALFVGVADEAICIGGSHPAESYLDQDKIIAAAKQTGA